MKIENLILFPAPNLKAIEEKKALIQHFKNTQTKRMRIIGDERLKNYVEILYKQAQQQGFNDPISLESYANFASYLGIGFYHDPRLPDIRWQMKSNRSPYHKIKEIAPLLEEYEHWLMNPKKNGYKEMLQQLMQYQYKDLPTYKNYGEVADFFRNNFPHYTQYITNDSLISIVGKADNVMKAHTLASSQGVIVYTGILLVLGIDTDKDLFYPWVKDYLGEKTNTLKNSDEIERQVTKLLRKAQSRVRKELIWLKTESNDVHTS